jgi:hypothetical protein
LQIGILQNQLQKTDILVRQSLIELFLLSQPLFPSFKDEDDDGERQWERLDKVKREFNDVFPVHCEMSWKTAEHATRDGPLNLERLKPSEAKN